MIADRLLLPGLSHGVTLDLLERCGSDSSSVPEDLEVLSIGW
jgi:hypothetical protein